MKISQGVWCRLSQVPSSKKLTLVRMSKWTMALKNKDLSQDTASCLTSAITCKSSPSIKMMPQWILTCWRNCLINQSGKTWCWALRTPPWYWLKTRCTRRMLVSSSLSSCSRNCRCQQFLYVKIQCWLRSHVADQLRSCWTQVLRRRLRLLSTMATLYKKVLCGTRSVARRYPNYFRPSSPMSTRLRLSQDTNSNASLGRLRVRSISMCSLLRWRTLIRLTMPGVRLR